ncbi:MAG: hypothetical protein GEV09_27175, partial [Pseudonocardiaceae bacterium]|nr:hypothetical protein [Pseudonocardiaceae bacterium]
MATAPRPRSVRKAVEADQVIKITVRGEEAVIRPGDWGPRDDALVRTHTRKALGEARSLLGALQELDEQTIGLDSICLLWWLGRYRAHLTRESYGDALDKFPSYGETDAIVLDEVVGYGEEG